MKEIKIGLIVLRLNNMMEYYKSNIYFEKSYNQHNKIFIDIKVKKDRFIELSCQEMTDDFYKIIKEVLDSFKLPDPIYNDKKNSFWWGTRYYNESEDIRLIDG